VRPKLNTHAARINEERGRRPLDEIGFFGAQDRPRWMEHSLCASPVRLINPHDDRLALTRLILSRLERRHDHIVWLAGEPGQACF
jgi:hypothetical protein